LTPRIVFIVYLRNTPGCHPKMKNLRRCVGTHCNNTISGQHEMNLWDPHGNQAASSRPRVYKYISSAQSHNVTPTEKLSFIPEEFYPFLDLVFVFSLASMETTYYWQTNSVLTSLIQPTGPEPAVGECVLMKLETDSGNISVFLCDVLLPR